MLKLQIQTQTTRRISLRLYITIDAARTMTLVKLFLRLNDELQNYCVRNKIRTCFVTRRLISELLQLKRQIKSETQKKLLKN